MAKKHHSGESRGAGAGVVSGPRQQLPATHAPDVQGPLPEFQKCGLDTSGYSAERPCLELVFPRFKNKPLKTIATRNLLKPG